MKTTRERSHAVSLLPTLMTSRQPAGILALMACLSLFLLAFSSCEEQQDAGSQGRYQLIKAYDYQIGDVLNSDYKVASTTDRYFMAFQIGLFNTYRTILLVADKSGKEISRDTLPSGINISSLIIQDDGSVLLAGFMWCCPNVNIFHYDQNATLLSYKTLYIPGINLLSFYNSPQFDQSLNGNILVYGNYFATGNFLYGFMAEVDMQGNIYWAKSHEVMISSAVSTSDNGYLASGYVPDTTGGIDVYLIKTNATGDSISANMIRKHAVQGAVNNIVRTSRNTYQVNYTEETPAYISTVFEADMHGNKLHSITMDNVRLGWLVPREDGRTLVLFSPYAYASGNGVAVRKSTYFVTLDAAMNVVEKYYFQNATNDLIFSACPTLDGKVACFGVIQSFKKDYYEPTLIVLN